MNKKVKQKQSAIDSNEKEKEKKELIEKKIS